MTSSAGTPAAPPRLRPTVARRPPLRPAVLLAIAAGGALGGLARETATSLWPPPPDGMPWAVFGVNTAGGLILGFLLVVTRAWLPPSSLVPSLLGTGFCGALTTFGAVAVSVDRFAAQGDPSLAVAYPLASLAAGLAATWLGVVLARGLVGRSSRDGAAPAGQPEGRV